MINVLDAVADVFQEDRVRLTKQHVQFNLIQSYMRSIPVCWIMRLRTYIGIGISVPYVQNAKNAENAVSVVFICKIGRDSYLINDSKEKMWITDSGEKFLKILYNCFPFEYLRIRVFATSREILSRYRFIDICRRMRLVD